MALRFSPVNLLLLLPMKMIITILLLDLCCVCHADPDPVDDICIADLSTGQRFAGGYPCKPDSQITADDLCNIGKGKAQTFAALNSHLPGGVSVPKNLFGSTPSIPDALLSKVFQVDEATVRSSKAKLADI
ncbi:hypothetical protein J5N97_019484 [Dioscorea zingiberensis]|uniref:Cupin type-1 domain-containing protein n=1 Tax=Dioscorea zingiberensis TaxID=325984 RepID=A0A9D5CEU1_9LILI|nr:hypothetical protein J5N97_019484 [Dioscorea zingiberensis]